MNNVVSSSGRCCRPSPGSACSTSRDIGRYQRCGRHSAACPSSPGSCSRRCPGTWTPCRSSPRHSPHPSTRWKSETAPRCSAAVRSDEHGRRCSGSIAHTAPRSTSRRSSHSTGHGSPTLPRNEPGWPGPSSSISSWPGVSGTSGLSRHGRGRRVASRISSVRVSAGPSSDRSRRARPTRRSTRASGRSARRSTPPPRPGRDPSGRDALIAWQSSWRPWRSYSPPGLGHGMRSGAGDVVGPPGLTAPRADRRLSLGQRRMVPRVLQATPTTDMRGPLRTAPSAARCREKVEA